MGRSDEQIEVAIGIASTGEAVGAFGLDGGYGYVSPSGRLKINRTRAAARVDRLAQLDNEIMALSDDGVFGRLEHLVREVNFTYLDCGGLLNRIKEQKLLGGMAEFRAYVQDKLGFGYDKAMQLIRVYKAVSAAGVSWDQIKSIAWTKMRVLENVLSKNTADHWLGMASTLSVIELTAAVRQHFGSGKPDKGDATKRRSFRLQVDQAKVVEAAISRQLAEQGYNDEEAALARICAQALENDNLDLRLTSLDQPALRDAAELVLKLLGRETAYAIMNDIFCVEDPGGIADAETQ